MSLRVFRSASESGTRSSAGFGWNSGLGCVEQQVIFIPMAEQGEDGKVLEQGMADGYPLITLTGRKKGEGILEGTEDVESE